MRRPALIVWDFDGVLNRNVINGRFVWTDDLQADLGVDPAALSAYLFKSGRIADVIRGKVDLTALLAEWLPTEAPHVTVDILLDYWFAKDARPDADVLSLLPRLAIRQVIGTNNEARRARYIETEMGFAEKVEHVFASGRMGVAKPDTAFFDAIRNWADIPAADILLIDDHQPNVEAAIASGWQGAHFTDETRDTVLAQLGAWT